MSKEYKFSDKNKLIIPLASTAVLTVLAFVLSFGNQRQQTSVTQAAYQAPAPVVHWTPSPSMNPVPTPQVPEPTQMPRGRGY